MKKIYFAPEIILRQITLEGMIALSTDPNPINPGDIEARENDDWGDDEESDNIWED